MHYDDGLKIMLHWCLCLQTIVRLQISQFGSQMKLFLWVGETGVRWDMGSNGTHKTKRRESLIVSMEMI